MTSHVIILGSLNNTLTFADDDYFVTGTDGNNTLTFGSGNDQLALGAGNNTLTLGGGTDEVTAGAGNNTMTLGGGSDHIVAGDGLNTITTGNGNDTIVLGNGFDQVTSGNGNSKIVVGNGAGDTITVGVGSNTIALGTGSTDIVHTGSGGNIVSVSAAALGSDTIQGGLTSGNGRQNKLALTTAGIVSPTGVSGFDTFQLATGGSNNLTLTNANFARLPDGLIVVLGGDSGETVNASALSAANAVNVYAGPGVNILTGGAGNDTFHGALGNTTIDGGGGVNRMIYAGPRSSYTISTSNGTTHVSAAGESDTLVNIALVSFAPAPFDFNGDGKSDLLVQNTNGAGIICTTNGLGATTAVSVGNPGPTWHIVASADFNGDGQPDLLLQNDNGGLVDYLMNGTSISAGYSLGNPGSSWHVRGTGDFNADGKADMVLQNDSGSLVILETSGTNLIGGVSVGSLPAGWAVEGVADFNGDGQPDILVQNTTGVLVDYTMNGTSIASGAVIGNPGPGYSVGGTGDYNGDGKADILLHNDNGVDVIWRMDGPTVMSAVFAGNPGVGYKTAETGIDLNGDGNSDLVIQNAVSSALVGYTLDSTAAITAGAVLGTPGMSWNMVGSNPMTFIDGTGSNLGLSATPGPDQFVLTSYAAGVHTITGFDVAQDMLALSKTVFPSYAFLQANEALFQGGTFINLSPSAAIVIQGITPDQLNNSNFALR